MNHSIVLYDACVLYPAPLRDLLMELATREIFKAKWSNKIHDEWIGSGGQAIMPQYFLKWRDNHLRATKNGAIIGVMSKHNISHELQAILNVIAQSHHSISLREICDKKAADLHIKQYTANHFIGPDIHQFVNVVETELNALHTGNIARYRISLKQFMLWQKNWF